MENRVLKKSVIIFSVMVVSSGWIGVLIEKLLSGKLKEGSTPGMGLWLVIPVLSVIILRVFMKNGWKPLGIKPKFKGNIKWYIFSILIFPVITIAVLTVGVVTNWIDISQFNIEKFLYAFYSIFISLFIKNIFEELSWRGFLTERLIKLNINDSKIYIIAGTVWFLWHIPYYLVLLTGTDINRIESIIYIFLTVGSWIIMFTELYRLTRSIWPCIILHAMMNALIVINDYITISQGKGFIFSYDTGIISLAICICIGLCMRKCRKSKEVK